MTGLDSRPDDSALTFRPRTPPPAPADGADPPGVGSSASRPRRARRPAGSEVRWLSLLMAANTVAAVGLFGDIASHVSVGLEPVDEDFLAGWHLVLYGGVAGVAAVLGVMALQLGPRAPLRLIPAACAGLAVLTVGGLADAAWHEAFGVEAALSALVSPPHLVILLGLVLLMVAPIGALARGPNRPLDPVQSLILALSITSLLLVVSLFTGYLTPLVGGSELQAGAYFEPLIGTTFSEYDTTRGLGTALWFGAMASAVVAVVRSRTAPVAGTWTLAFGLLGLAPLVASGSTVLPVTLGLVAFGLVSDLTATRSRPHPLASAAATGLMWAVMFGAIGVRGDLMWAMELWSGVIATGVLVGGATGATVRWVTATPRDRAAGPARGQPG